MTSQAPTQSDKPATNPPEENPDTGSDTDSLLAKLESELDILSTEDLSSQNASSLPPTTSSLLLARKAELQSQLQSQFQAPATTIPGGRIVPSTYTKNGIQTPSSEESLIKATADAPAAVVAFYSLSFASSVRMRDLLSMLARQYALQNSGVSRDHERGGDDDEETLFFAAEAEKREWLCRRLGVKVLPVVIGYVDGREVGRIVGFEGLKGGEKAGWQALGWVVGAWGGSWNGTLRKGNGGSVLGRRWVEWVGGEAAGSAKDQDTDEESNEDEKDRRRSLGFIGGAKASRGSKIGGQLRASRVAKDEDDDWD